MIDDLVGQTRWAADRLQQLSEEARRDRTASLAREIRELRREVGLALRELRTRLRHIDESETRVARPRAS
jgi:hypothetical protein